MGTNGSELKPKRCLKYKFQELLSSFSNILLKGFRMKKAGIIFKNLINIYSIDFCSDEVWRGGMLGMQ